MEAFSNYIKNALFHCSENAFRYNTIKLNTKQIHSSCYVICSIVFLLPNQLRQCQTWGWDKSVRMDRAPCWKTERRCLRLPGKGLFARKSFTWFRVFIISSQCFRREKFFQDSSKASLIPGVSHSPAIGDFTWKGACILKYITIYFFTLINITKFYLVYLYAYLVGIESSCCISLISQFLKNRKKT